MYKILDTEEKIQNPLTFIIYRPDCKELFIQDLKDQNNLPAMVTTTKRSVPKAWEYIKANWNEDLRLWDIYEILKTFKVRTHYWCMMD